MLKRRKDYRIWVNRLTGLLKQKEVVYHLNFDVQMPILLLPQPQTNPFIIPNVLLPNHLSSLPGRLPPRIKDLLAQTREEIMCFHEDSEHISNDLFPLACDSFILIIGVLLFPIYKEKKEWQKGCRKYLKETQLVSNVIQTSLAVERLHVFSSCNNNYHGFHQIQRTFFKESKLEQSMLLNKMSRIKYKNLQTYIDQFYSLICEYEAVQGNRNDQVIQTLFLSKLPEKYSSEKNTYCGQNIDQALEYFKNVSDREAAYSTKPTNEIAQSQKINQVNQRPKQRSFTRTFHKPSNITFNKRCSTCGGFGHDNTKCVTKNPVCHICGSQEHYKINCPLRRKFIRSIKINLPTEDDEQSEFIITNSNSSTPQITPTSSSHSTPPTSSSKSTSNDTNISNDSWQGMFHMMTSES